MADILARKTRTLADIFYNPRTGFGSIEQVLGQARQQDASISRDDVRAFIRNQEIRQRRKPTRVNGYVASLPRQEFQVDLMDMGSRAAPRYGFVAIDVFTKKAVCIPILSKSPDDTTPALKTVFEELGYPVSIMLDEGGEFEGKFAQLAKDNEVEIVKSRTGGRFVERFIRTLKARIFDRRESLGGHWTGYIKDVIESYNEDKHHSTHYAPDAIADDEYNMPMVHQAWSNMVSHAKFPVKHEQLQIGDRVKIRIKPSGHTDYKETFNSWSKEVYTVESIDQTQPQGTVYQLEGYRRPLLRFELLKIRDVQRPVEGGGVASVLQSVQHGAPRGFTEAEKAKLESLTPFKEELVNYVGQGKWVHEMAAKMKELGMADIVKNGLNYPKALCCWASISATAARSLTRKAPRRVLPP